MQLLHCLYCLVNHSVSGSLSEYNGFTSKLCRLIIYSFITQLVCILILLSNWSYRAQILLVTLRYSTYLKEPADGNPFCIQNRCLPRF